MKCKKCNKAMCSIADNKNAGIHIEQCDHCGIVHIERIEITEKHFWFEPLAENDKKAYE